MGNSPIKRVRFEGDFIPEPPQENTAKETQKNGRFKVKWSDKITTNFPFDKIGNAIKKTVKINNWSIHILSLRKANNTTQKANAVSQQSLGKVMGVNSQFIQDTQEAINASAFELNKNIVVRLSMLRGNSLTVDKMSAEVDLLLETMDKHDVNFKDRYSELSFVAPAVNANLRSIIELVKTNVQQLKKAFLEYEDLHDSKQNSQKKLTALETERQQITDKIAQLEKTKRKKSEGEGAQLKEELEACDKKIAAEQTKVTELNGRIKQLQETMRALEFERLSNIQSASEIVQERPVYQVSEKMGS